MIISCRYTKQFLVQGDFDPQGTFWHCLVTSLFVTMGHVLVGRGQGYCMAGDRASMARNFLASNVNCAEDGN
jgi:hypothetical protein